MATETNFEDLGAFYLGKAYDLASKERCSDPLLYEHKDLTTHAFCVGMTGSGKTGLCVSLLEEAAMDGIPAICIDPKGDIANLFLTFPALRTEDFEPWVDPAQASRLGRTIEEHAAAVSTSWREGLADWGQSGQRIAAMRDRVELQLFTPGLASVAPLQVMGSFQAPDEASRSEVLSGVVEGLLSLLDVDSSPASRDYVLLASILDLCWKRSESPDLAALVRYVMEPPIARIGVLDLETFYPAKERQALALRINGLLANPSFSAWLAGPPLDIGKMLFSEGGKPRMTVISIAHLSDKEREFFVTRLLGSVLTWMRAQPGTTSLRALLYMDEVFGFLPPVREPATKRLFLTLLKQARAYGLGLVLATQNPVDIDYRALSNCGTWFLGRLQTAQDVARVVDGLMTATQAGGASREELERVLTALPSRVFLMNNVHEGKPIVFHSRFAMSYLAGPLNTEQLRRLVAPAPQAALNVPVSANASDASPTAIAATRPLLQSPIGEVFVGPVSGDFVYHPAFLATARVHFQHPKSGLDVWQERSFLAPLVEAAPADLWNGAHEIEPAQYTFAGDPVNGSAGYLELPAKALETKRVASVTTALKNWAFQGLRHRLGYSKTLKVFSAPSEAYEQFVQRIEQGLREQRDLQIQKVKTTYEGKLAKAAEAISKAEAKLTREKSEADAAKMDSVIGVGTTMLGAIFGRGSVVSKASSAARRATKASKASADVDSAQTLVSEARAAHAALLAEAQGALESVAKSSVVADVEVVEVSPKKTDIEVIRMTFAWVPVSRNSAQ